MNPVPLLLPFAGWPAADRLAWNELFADGDLLDGRGVCFGWAAGSRAKREQSYSRWLGFLSAKGALESASAVAARVTPQSVVEFIEVEQQRNKMITVYMRIEDLLSLCKVFDPQTDWGWFSRIMLRLRAVSDLGYLKPNPGVDAMQVFDWACKQMQAADGESGPVDLNRAVRFRDGLMVGTLISTPLRRRTFLTIRIGEHLQPTATGFLLKFKPADIKDKRPHDFPLHPWLAEPMRRYLLDYRPVLLQVNSAEHLWVSRRGVPLCADSFAGHLEDLTRRAFGIKLGPHAFRHVAATTIAMWDPEHVNIIADVLGQASLTMSHKHYIHAGNTRAISRWQELRHSLKKEARYRSSEARRIAALRSAGDEDS